MKYKIRENANLKELEKFGFYLEGNTYKYDLGEEKCFSICTINKEIIEPNIEKTYHKFYRENDIRQKLDEMKFKLLKTGILEKV